MLLNQKNENIVDDLILEFTKSNLKKNDEFTLGGEEDCLAGASSS